MAVGQDFILGPKGANLIGDDGKITQSARDKFVNEVLALQLSGNENGLGISKFNPLIQIPLFPFPGPTLPGITGPSPLFWFKSEPFALLSAPQLLKKDGTYQKIVVDGIYEPLIKMLNFKGKTSLGPIFDPTIFIDTSMPKFKDLKLPDLPSILGELVVLGGLAQIMPLPGIAAKGILALDYGIVDPKLPLDLIPLLLAPPIPSPPIPSLPAIPIPDVPNPGLPSFFIPELATGLFKAPGLVFPKIIGELTSISFDPLEIIIKIIKLIIEIILKILEIAGIFIAPLTLLSATLTILVKNLAGMILCDLVGSLFGTGLIVKIISTLIGLS